MKKNNRSIYTQHDKEYLTELITSVENKTTQPPTHVKINNYLYRALFRPSSKPNNSHLRLEIMDDEPIADSNTCKIIPSLGVFRHDKKDSGFFKPPQHIVKEVSKPNTSKSLESFTRQIENEALKTANSPELKGKPLTESENSFFIVMNHQRGLDLFEFIEHELLYKKDTAKVLQIIKAVLYAYKAQFADRKLMHGDIKPENIIIIKQKDGSYRAVFIDLEFTKSFAELEHPDSCSAWGGTRIYLAPEIITNKAIIPKNDLFSLGLTIAEALGNARINEIHDQINDVNYEKKPAQFKNNKVQEMRAKKIFDFTKSTVSNDALTLLMPLLKGLTHIDPKMRCSIDMAIRYFDRKFTNVEKPTPPLLSPL